MAIRKSESGTSSREKANRTRVDSNIFEGIRQVELHHGLILGSSTVLNGTFDDICYCSETKEYLVLDTGIAINRFSMQGKPIRPPYQLGSTMLFTRMLWCSPARVLTCHIPHDDMIWIIDIACKLVQIIRNEFKIEDLFYSSITNQIVVVGMNKITIFPMEDVEHPLNNLYTVTYLDSSYGALWSIECSSLIERSSAELAVAGSYLTNIYIMSLRQDRPIEGSSQFVDKKLGATIAPITALCYHRMCEWLITADNQGNIAGWSLKLECVMSCPNGHEDQVRLIVQHPSICGFLTISNGAVLQAWSCNLRGKIESFRDVGQIRRIAINEIAASLATLGNNLCCFHMNQLYVFYAPLTAPATNLYATTNPTFPTRVIVTSVDNTARILSSRTGRQINVQIISRKLEVMAAAYSAITSRMYTIILRTGEILVSSLKTKPMSLRYVWVNDDRTITCIVAYESLEKIVSIDGTENVTLIPVSTLIVVGTLDGKLIVIEETSGKHLNVYSAHDKSIIDLSCSRISRQLVSLGRDKCVKVWRIYPDIMSPLVLVCCVYWTFSITRVSSLGFTVCMVGSTERSTHHRIIMYDTSERIRLEHHPSEEHSDLITSICTLESLEICASSSLDKTIRIWNRRNELLKVLEMNTVAGRTAFSSLRGDLVFSAGKHLYRIPHENYLSPEYRARIIVDKIPHELDDAMIAGNIDYRIYDDEIDREKALHPVSSTPFGSLDSEKSEAPKLQHMLLEQIALNERYRDEDIRRIKEGTIKAMRLVGKKSTMSKEAWDKHLMELLDASKKAIDNDLPDVMMSLSSDFFKNAEDYWTAKKVLNEPEVFRMIHGYSVPSLDTECLQEIAHFSKLPRSGFFPNSLIYKIQEDRVDEEAIPEIEKRKFKYQYPPEILFGDTTYDSQENLDTPMSLSQLMSLGIGEEEALDD